MPKLGMIMAALFILGGLLLLCLSNWRAGRLLLCSLYRLKPS